MGIQRTRALNCMERTPTLHHLRSMSSKIEHLDVSSEFIVSIFIY